MRTTLAATAVVGLAMAVAALVLVLVLQDVLSRGVRDAALLRAADVVAVLESGMGPGSLAVDDEEELLIQIVLAEHPATFELVVKDDGIGLRNAAETAGRSSGQQVVKRIVGSYLKGVCSWQSSDGTTVTVEFPKPREV